MSPLALLAHSPPATPPPRICNLHLTCTFLPDIPTDLRPDLRQVAFLRHMVTSLAHQQGASTIQVPADYDYTKASCVLGLGLC